MMGKKKELGSQCRFYMYVLARHWFVNDNQIVSCQNGPSVGPAQNQPPRFNFEQN